MTDPDVTNCRELGSTSSCFKSFFFLKTLTTRNSADPIRENCFNSQFDCTYDCPCYKNCPLGCPCPSYPKCPGGGDSTAKPLPTTTAETTAEMTTGWPTCNWETTESFTYRYSSRQRWLWDGIFSGYQIL